MFLSKSRGEAFGGELTTQGECLKGKEMKPKGEILVESIFEEIYKERGVNEGDFKNID